MKIITIILICLSPFTFHLRNENKKTDSKKIKKNDVVQIVDPISRENKSYVFDHQIHDLSCDTFVEIKFWRTIMSLSKDSGYINIGHTRVLIEKFATIEWNGQSEAIKTAYRDSIKQVYGLLNEHRVLFTEGKSFFYDFDKAYPKLSPAIKVFQKNDVDPWYAQAILLIESPNKLQKSNVGAFGPFQLMKEVALKYGLKVNRQVDERASLERSAYGASMLMKKICVPKTKEMLDTLGIKYDENDLWFRLLVLHAYHAGIGNVRAAVHATERKDGGFELIRQLWHTTAKGFKYASQSYSQVALAAMIEMDLRMEQELKGATR